MSRWRDLILRIYWDDQEHPSVEAPLGDFFACGWDQYAQVSSLAVCVNPGRAFNCYWEMPFRSRARITLENRDPDDHAIIYYQINYTLTDVPADAAYFHARFRRTNPLPFKEDYVILDGVAAAATTSAPTWPGASTTPAGGARARSSSSWMATSEFPTICGTGTEDYFCGAYNFDVGTVDPQFPRAYVEFTTPYAGLPQVIRPDGTYRSQQRFGLYRWHIMDPIRFERDLEVTIQALGWRTEKQDRRYLPLQDDIASVAFWYQTLPTAPFPALPDRDYLRGHLRRRQPRRLAAHRTRRCSRTAVGAEVGPLRRGDQAFALRALAGELARAADRLALLARLPFGGLLVVALALQLAEDALALQLLLEHLEGLIDVVVADEHLHFEKDLS